MTNATLPSRAAAAAHVSTLLLPVGIALATSPASAASCAGFVDVDDASAFCANVTWIRNRGITLGCTANQY